MKKAKLILLSLLLCFGMVFVYACKQEDPAVLADGIYLTETSVDLTLGDFATIGVNITPDDVTSKDFEVNALTKDVVTIDLDKENMQFVVNAPNAITNGFATVMLEVKTLDGSNLNAHVTINLKERYTPIDAPEYLHYNESTYQLEWAEVLGASGYKLNINGTDLPMVYTNTYALDSSFVGQDIVAKVCAVAEDGSESEYTEHSFKILASPANLVYEDGTISWQAVDGATSYNVYFDGKVEQCFYTQLYVLDRFSEPKTYQIKVMAVGNEDENIASSEYGELLEITKLDLPKNIRIVNGVVLWENVENSSSYKIYLDDNEPFNTSHTKLVLPQSLSAGAHTFKIATCGDEKTYISSAISTNLNFEKLYKVSNIYIENGNVCWTPNLQATSYMLYVNGAPYQTTNIEVTSVDFADYNSGTYNLNVKAIGNGGNVLDSDLMQQDFQATKLATPNNLHIDTTNGQSYVAWDEVENASAYLLAINNDDPIIINSNNYLLQVDAGSYNIKVMALGDSTKYINSNYSAMFVTTKLNDVTGLTVQNGELSWNLVSGAGKYQVLINNQTLVETTNNKFDMQSNDTNTFDSGIYTISVKAVASSATNIDSEYCDNISVTKLAVPQVAVRHGALVDAQVDGSSRIEYKVSILNSAGEVVNIQTKNSLEGFGSETHQQFKIIAKAYANTPEQGAVMYINSDQSAEFSCIQLPKVTDISITNGIVHFADTTYKNLTEGFTFDLEVFDTQDSNVLTNTKLYNLQPTQKDYNFTTLSASSYTYKITAKPNCNSNGESLLTVPYLTSVTSNENTVTVLSAPENAKISSIADSAKTLTELFGKIQSISSDLSGILVWDKVEDATKYSIMIDGAEKLVTSSTSCNLLDILADDGLEHKITIKSIGNGTNIITSLVGQEVNCIKLNRPTSLSCDGSSVSWESEYNQNLSLLSLTSNNANIVLYVAVINGKEYVTLNTKDLSLNNIAEKLSSKIYDLPELDAGEYVTNIYAIPLNAYVSLQGEVFETEGTKYVLSEYNTNELYLSSLIAPQGLEMNFVDDKQMLSWSPLRYEQGEVDKYVVCQVLGDDETEHSVDFGTTEWEFKDYSPATYHFAVYAKAKAGAYFERSGKKYYYIDSNQSQYIETTVMENPELYVQNGVVNWNGIEGVEKYELIFGKENQSQETKEFDPSITQFELGEDYLAGNYTFKIRAKGDGTDYITSEYCSTKTFTKLDYIKNIRLEKGVIVYDQNTTVASETNSCYYQLIVNGKIVSNNKLTSTELEGFAGGNYTLYIYAFGDNDKYLTSNVSDSLTCIKLAYPASTSLNNGVLTWIKANNASSYQLDIAGSIVSDIVGVTYDFNNIEYGDYAVRVKAIGNNVTYVNSDWTKSNVISKLDEIKNLRVENGQITWDKVKGTYKDIRLKIKLSTESSYKEIKLDGSATSYVLDDTYIAGNYDVCLYNAGGSNAISSNESSVLNVVKLNIPTNLRITTEDSLQYLEFDSVANAGSYKLSITINTNGNNQNAEFNVNITKIPTSSLEDLGISIQNSGTYILSVMANGTTSPYVNSDYSSKLTITKPESPVLVDVKTTEGMSSGLVTWQAVEDADYYRVVMIKDGVVADEFTTENTYIYVTNKANYTIQVTSCKDLNGFDSETSEITLSYALFDGSGTKDDPYRIKTAQDFNNVSYNLTAYYQLVDNLDFGTTGLKAISTEANPFVGTLDGNNYKITGVSITTYNDVVGLIPVIGQEGSIINLTVDISISSGKTVGGITAVNNGKIENCVVNGTISPIYNVSSTVLNAGGIAGINNGTISKSINNATINPQNNMNITYAGGITATNNGTISGCGNNGDVSATYAGGIAAYTTGNISYSYNNYNASIVATVFNMGGLTCPAYAGGIVGYATSATADGIKVYTCYNVGSVVATSQYNAIYPYAGGIVGYNNGANIENCYATGVDGNGNIIISVTTSNNGRGYAGILVGYNAKGTIEHTNVSVYVSSSQVDAYTNSGFISRIRFIYTDIDEYTILNNLYSGTYEEGLDIYPTIIDFAKY